MFLEPALHLDGPGLGQIHVIVLLAEGIGVAIDVDIRLRVFGDQPDGLAEQRIRLGLEGG